MKRRLLQLYTGEIILTLGFAMLITSFWKPEPRLMPCLRLTPSMRLSVAREFPLALDDDLTVPGLYAEKHAPARVAGGDR